MRIPTIRGGADGGARSTHPSTVVPAVKGRIVRPSGGGVGDLTVVVRSVGDSPTSLPAATPGQDGRFQFPLAEPVAGPLKLVISSPQGPEVEVEIPPEGLGDEIVVVVAEETPDPRAQVDRVTKELEAEREATDSARVTLAAEVTSREAKEQQIRRTVDSLLSDLAEEAGGDTTWKSTAGRPISSLMANAVQDGRRVVSESPPAIAVSSDKVQDGDELRTAELVARLTGTPQPRDGYWRIDPLERLRLRQKHSGLDGLPKPDAGTAPVERDLRPVTPDVAARLSEAAEALVTEKTEKLVDAMRLPEDPPLLTAESAVRGAGPDVEFARGIADNTAFHFFYEMIPALPDVWQEVFDRRFASVVEAAVRELDAAGVPFEDLAEPVASTNGNGATPADRLVERLGHLATVYDTTSAARIRPRSTSMVAPASSIGGGVTDSSGMVLFRVIDDFPRPRDDDDPRGGGPPGGGGGGGSGGGDGGGGIGGSSTNQPKDTSTTAPPSTIPSLLRELESFLRGKHSFTVFAAKGKQRAINFGVLLTWRHEMEPLSYQVGEIAHTMTLAPGEKRKIVTKQKRSVKRSTAETEKALRSIKSETTDTMRAESEIIRKANASTDFHLSAEGSTNMLVQGGTFKTNGTRKVGRDGNDTRRRFREAVIKAAQEVRNERSMEVKEESEDLFEEETTAEVVNPNDEIAMTAVFYTLQRRYRLKERLYRARPVIMVALPMPDPAEITTAWLIRYAWIIRRNLLDDRFAAALDYLTDTFLGDSETLVHLEQTLRRHEKALNAAEHRLRSARAVIEHRSNKLADLRKELAENSEGGVVDELFDLSGLSVARDVSKFAKDLFGGADDDQAERERRALLLEAVEEDLARAEREAREGEAQVAGASSALQEATRDFVNAKRRTRNHEVRIAELRVHVSDNILHYMHGKWAAEPPDQRFFELHDVLVPVLGDTVRVTEDGTFDQPGLDGITPKRFRLNFAEEDGPLTFRSLAEVCDLDEPLGFRGNFAIFPMKEGNALTDLILAPYIDEHEILRDPEDIAASWTLSDLEEYADRLRADPEVNFEDHVDFLKATLERLLTAPRLSEEEIVVPTDSLYVDLLTSGGTLLEPFKREHRALDVEKVREELRADKLDSLRRAARIAEGELADPDMDDFERHLVRGDGSGASLPPPTPSE